MVQLQNMKNLLLLFPLMVVLLVSSAGADDRFESSKVRQFAGKMMPLAELPEGIAYKKDGLSLVADYEKRGPKGTPLYLVNAGEKDRPIHSQGGELFIKLEFLNKDGEWQGAQTHGYSFCGNSYLLLTLKAGHFFKVQGYRPLEGRKAKVRYKFRGGGVVSEFFEGLVREQDIEGAAFDQVEVRKYPSMLVGPFEISPFFNYDRWRPENAWHICQNAGYLGELETSFVMWKEYGTVPILRYGGRDFVNCLEKAAESDERIVPFAEKFRKLYEEPFHPKASPAQLVRYCLTQLDEPNGREYWDVLTRLFFGDLPDSARENILSEAIHREFSERLFFQDPAGRQLRSDEQVWAILEKAKTLKFRTKIWTLLIYRGFEKEVIQKVSERPMDEIVSVLKHYSPSHFWNENGLASKEEVRLWKRAFEHDPLAIFATMKYWLTTPKYSRSFDFLKPQVEAFWQKQLKKMDEFDGDFELKGESRGWSGAFEALKNLEGDVDVARWEKLASFTGYYLSRVRNMEVGKTVDLVYHDYSICNWAADYLGEMNHKVERVRERKVLVSETIRRADEK